jgi:hypothetical protein
MYGSLSDFQSGAIKKLPFVALFKVARYQFNWIPTDKWNQKTYEYTDGVDDLSMKHLDTILTRKLGRTPTEAERREYMPVHRELSDYETVGFGLGNRTGVEGNARGKSYIAYNRHAYKTLEIEYYGVKEDGHLVGPIPKNVGHMLDQDYNQNTLEKKPDDISGLGGIKRAGATPEEIEEYIKQYNELVSNLKFLPAQIINSQVLYMAAAVQKQTPEGGLEDSGSANEKVVWLNDAIPTHFESIDNKTGKYNYNFDVDPGDLYKIAIEKIDRDYQMMLESKRRKGIRLTESELKQVVKEAAMKIVRNILSENRNRVLSEHDMYALGRGSAHALERSAKLAKEMGQTGEYNPGKIAKMKHQDRLAHNANKLQNKLIGLDPNKEYGRLNDPTFGAGFNDFQSEYKG